MTVKIVSDHGFPKGDGSLPTDDPFSRFKNERDYVAQSGRNKTTVAAMDWAASEIDRLTAALSDQVGGWQLVPKEPTPEMLEAALALDAVSKGVLVPAGPYDVWQAMIAAAPPPASPAVEEKR